MQISTWQAVEECWFTTELIKLKLMFHLSRHEWNILNNAYKKAQYRYLLPYLLFVWQQCFLTPLHLAIRFIRSHHNWTCRTLLLLYMNYLIASWTTYSYYLMWYLLFTLCESIKVIRSKLNLFQYLLRIHRISYLVVQKHNCIIQGIYLALKRTNQSSTFIMILTYNLGTLEIGI